MGKLKLDLATNFDTKLLDYVKEIDRNHQVISMFGKVKADMIGGGRASVALKDVSFNEVGQYNQICKSMGIHLNYLMNPLTLSNKDIIPEEHKKLMDYIGALYDLGIEWVTICSPYLLQLIKKQFPKMKVTIGVYAYIGSLCKVKSWIDMGADELTLMENCTRNFDFLETVLTEYKGRDVNFRIIANNGCLHECPYSLNHAGAVSAGSQTGSATEKKYFDFSLVNCYYRKISEPANMLASDWIRPEDLHYYEELCDRTGNDRLVIKLVERTKSTGFLCNVVKAYIDEKYEGNLLDIMNWIGNDPGSQSFDVSEYVESMRKGELDMDTLLKYSSFFALPPLYLDNKRLDGFIQHFINGFQCDKKMCWLNDKDPENKFGGYCYYCREWAKKAILINGAERNAQEKETYEKWIVNAGDLKERFNTSQIFGGNNQ